ncbi:MAG: 50S ribosomal protein L10 [Candidatus Scalindua sp.]|jgi:large subunit ribosomal protein L10|nr:50S ribosomal protein L10 [Candidatus Scalindua sp.]MBT5305795.1 50S ribosomal protein L10 [Candidatus Scalindua sp.]MBT6226212.1 50S ribosomal protein L10 [Candidatus Scalindua sp.]MBT6561336.1 50S ribosomal protein L10 [Candidatus Scalindua sp.]MBT7211517.1 50S ribosomal protein L10 [Candidatus Scalindua sp.]
MSKALKKLIVEELIADYRDKKNLVLVNFKGIDAQQTNILKRDLSEKNIKARVVKNSLAAIAFKEVGIETLGQMLAAPTVVATNEDDPVELAKTLKKYSKEISGFDIVGGWVDGELMSVEDISTLASIPPREVVLTQIVFAVQAPMVQVANVFNATAKSLCQVLHAIKEKKSEV